MYPYLPILTSGDSAYNPFEQCDQYAGQVVRMITVQGKMPIRTVLAGVRRLMKLLPSEVNDESSLPVCEIRTESPSQPNKDSYHPVDAITGYLTRRDRCHHWNDSNGHKLV